MKYIKAFFIVIGILLAGFGTFGGMFYVLTVYPVALMGIAVAIFIIWMTILIAADL